MARALYLELDPDPVFVVLHETETRPEVGVLFCSPFGWEDMASHRARRDWAEELAAAGCAVLRFDPPGSGDSGGLPSDPGRFPAWLDAIDAAARWLRITTGCERVVAVGFGLGGLLAVSAAQRGAPI